MFVLNQLLVSHLYSFSAIYIHSPSPSSNNKQTSHFPSAKEDTQNFQAMESKVGKVYGTASAKSFRNDREPIPLRGQIKSRIAANALHSIVSVLLKASSDHHHSTGKLLFREI